MVTVREPPCESAFAAAMPEHDIKPPATFIAAGRIHRFDAPGEKRGRKSGVHWHYGDGMPAVQGDSHWHPYPVHKRVRLWIYQLVHKETVSGQVHGIERAFAGWRVPVTALPSIASLSRLNPETAE